MERLSVGLQGETIPLVGRIVAIADAYDAMVHDRPYQSAVSHDAAVSELRKHAGIQFDPELVDIFCGLFSNSVPRPDPTLLVAPPLAAADLVQDHDGDHEHGHHHGTAASA